MKHSIQPILLALSLALSLAAASSGASAGDIEAGKAIATKCVACHGSNGISTNAVWPNLAGQKNAYLKQQIIAFRDGQRSNPLMSPMVAGLSDADAENLADYYASLKAE